MKATVLPDQIRHCVGQSETVERERTQPWNHLVDRIVHAGSGIDDQSRRIRGPDVAAFTVLRDRQRNALHGRNSLPKLIVQLARDLAPFFLDMRPDHLCQFAILLQLPTCLVRPAAGR